MKVKPYGILRVQHKNYFLLRPEPIVKDSWQLDFQQRWYVAECFESYPTDAAEDCQYYSNGISFQIVCTSPIIEYRWDLDEIEIGNIEQQAEVDLCWEAAVP